MSSHVPVLINQVLEFLRPAPGKVFIDCTLGAGGHSEALLKNMGSRGFLYGIEADERNLEIAKKRLGDYSTIHYLHDNFENLEKIGEDVLKKEGKIDGILFDLGLSSLHVDEKERGFSFRGEGPLDMRFDTRQKLTAADIVNTYPLEELFFIFQTYGQEKFSYRIARKITEHRGEQRFTTTSQLADFIKSAVPHRYYFKIHPATRVFQALRIATNREIEVLETGLAAAVKVVSKGGRIVVISYHSLEDRLVKHFFRSQAQSEMLKILTKRPVVPSEEEIEDNPRSRSAKLRSVEKI